MELELPEGSTVGRLAEEMLRLHPAITRDPSTLVVAVNQEFADHAHILAHGDEVALIPPVSGGSPRKLAGCRRASQRAALIPLTSGGTP